MQTEFSNLGRTVRCTTEYDLPDRYRDLTADRDGLVIARGAGLSYVDASFGSGVESVSTRRFNRILSFDARSRTIRVEAGISLGKLFSFLIPHKLHLTIQPGHPQITIGGCIAANVHGKNQGKEGNFRNIVRSLELFHPDKGVMTIGPDSHSDIFDLTCGGFGLTGIILSAELQLSSLPGGAIEINHHAVSGLEEGFSRISDLSENHDMSYAWIDLSRADAHNAAGFIVTGRYTETAAGQIPDLEYEPLDPSRQRRVEPKIYSRFTMPLINRYYHWRETRPGRKTIPIVDFLFPAVKNKIYFDLFGRGGFIEQQLLVPEESLKDFIVEFRRCMKKHNQPIVLATIKTFKGERTLLNYDGTGYSFTIDIWNDDRSLRFLTDLDEIAADHRAIGNIIKDSRLGEDVVKRQYGSGYDTFREQLHVFDPHRRFASGISKRLKL